MFSKVFFCKKNCVQIPIGRADDELGFHDTLVSDHGLVRGRGSNLQTSDSTEQERRIWPKNSELLFKDSMLFTFWKIELSRCCGSVVSVLTFNPDSLSLNPLKSTEFFYETVGKERK